MARYVNYDKLLEERHRLGLDEMSQIPKVNAFNLFIDKLPTADVVKVKHGEWIYHECVASHEGTISGYSCSVCSAFVYEDVFDTDEFHKKYCGYCGAKLFKGA